jgi:hypothetical protein
MFLMAHCLLYILYDTHYVVLLGIALSYHEIRPGVQ